MACLENPITLYLYQNNLISYDHDEISYFGGQAQKHWVIRQKIQHSEFDDKVCHVTGIDKNTFSVIITLRHTIILKGSLVLQYFLVALDDDDAMDFSWYMSDEFKLVDIQVLVEFEGITTTHTKTYRVQHNNGPLIFHNFTTNNMRSFISLLMDDEALLSSPIPQNIFIS